jgi:hypothetical protein
MAAGTVALRPSADISLGHNRYPTSGSSTGFDRINETTQDGSSTYISYETTASGSATSQFKLSGSIPEGMKCTGAKFCAVCNLTGNASDKTCNIDAGITVNGTTYSGTVNIPTGGAFTMYSVDIPDVISAINSYISQYGTFPAVTLTLTTNIILGAEEKKEANNKITQVYLELSYEEQTGTGIHMKIGGGWKEATQAFKKVNGAWVEITADECKTILRNSEFVIGKS